MTITRKLTFPMLGALVVALAACTHSSTYDVREAYGCTGPDFAETCHYPTLAQAVVIDGAPHEYLHYRDNNGAREFYLNGAWRKADPGQPSGRS